MPDAEVAGRVRPPVTAAAEAGAGPGDWIDTVSRSRARAVFGLVLLALLCFLPGFFSLPAVDRDEARFAQAARQMVASGDWIDIRLQEVPRYRQPVGIYWLQSLFVAPLGEDGVAPIWVHRLPSLLGAVAAVLLTWWVALPLAGRRAAFLAGALMAASLILGVEARLAKTDAVLLATVLLAHGALIRAWLARKAAPAAGPGAPSPWRLAFWFWTALAVGILVKGPLIVLFVGLTAAGLSLWDRSPTFLKALRPLPGLLWLLVLVLPWFVAIGIRSNGDFYRIAIGFSVVGKIAQGHEGHGLPPLTHLAAFWATFWPGSLLLAACLPAIWRQRREAWLRPLVCWVVPAWIVFEIVANKLPHYVLPMLPALAIAASGIVASRGTVIGRPAGRVVVQILLGLLTIAALAAVAAAAWFADGEALGLRFVAVTTIGVVLLGGAFLAIVRGLRQDRLAAIAGPLLAGVIAFYWLFYPSMARIEALWPGPALARIIAGFDGCAAPFLVSAGYAEPSLVFSTRTDILLADGAGAAAALAGRDCALALIERRELAAFEQGVGQAGIAARPIGTVSGYNIGSAGAVDIVVLAAEKAAGP